MTHPANDPVATCTIQSRVQISRLNDVLPGKYNAATSTPDDVAVVEDTNPAPCASSETTFRRTASAAMTSSVCACSELSFEDPTAVTRECRHGRQTPIVRVVSASLCRAGPARQVESASEISSSRRSEVCQRYEEELYDRPMSPLLPPLMKLNGDNFEAGNYAVSAFIERGDQLLPEAYPCTSISDRLDILRHSDVVIQVHDGDDQDLKTKYGQPPSPGGAVRRILKHLGVARFSKAGIRGSRPSKLIRRRFSRRIENFKESDVGIVPIVDVELEPCLSCVRENGVFTVDERFQAVFDDGQDKEENVQIAEAEAGEEIQRSPAANKSSKTQIRGKHNPEVPVRIRYSSSKTSVPDKAAVEPCVPPAKSLIGQVENGDSNLKKEQKIPLDRTVDPSKFEVQEQGGQTQSQVDLEDNPRELPDLFPEAGLQESNVLDFMNESNPVPAKKTPSRTNLQAPIDEDKQGPLPPTGNTTTMLGSSITSYTELKLRKSLADQPISLKMVGSQSLLNPGDQVFKASAVPAQSHGNIHLEGKILPTEPPINNLNTFSIEAVQDIHHVNVLHRESHDSNCPPGRKRSSNVGEDIIGKLRHMSASNISLPGSKLLNGSPALPTTNVANDVPPKNKRSPVVLKDEARDSVVQSVHPRVEPKAHKAQEEEQQNFTVLAIPITDAPDPGAETKATRTSDDNKSRGHDVLENQPEVSVLGMAALRQNTYVLDRDETIENLNFDLYSTLTKVGEDSLRPPRTEKKLFAFSATTIGITEENIRQIDATPLAQSKPSSRVLLAPTKKNEAFAFSATTTGLTKKSRRNLYGQREGPNKSSSRSLLAARQQDEFVLAASATGLTEHSRQHLTSQDRVISRPSSVVQHVQQPSHAKHKNNSSKLGSHDGIASPVKKNEFDFVATPAVQTKKIAYYDRGRNQDQYSEHYITNNRPDNILRDPSGILAPHGSTQRFTLEASGRKTDKPSQDDLRRWPSEFLSRNAALPRSSQSRPGSIRFPKPMCVIPEWISEARSLVDSAMSYSELDLNTAGVTGLRTDASYETPNTLTRVSGESLLRPQRSDVASLTHHLSELEDDVFETIRDDDDVDLRFRSQQEGPQIPDYADQYLVTRSVSQTQISKAPLQEEYGHRHGVPNKPILLESVVSGKLFLPKYNAEVSVDNETTLYPNRRTTPIQSRSVRSQRGNGFHVNNGSAKPPCSTGGFDKMRVPYGNFTVSSDSRKLTPQHSKSLVGVGDVYQVSEQVSPRRQLSNPKGHFQAIVATASVPSEMRQQAGQMRYAPASFVESQRPGYCRPKMTPESLGYQPTRMTVDPSWGYQSNMPPRPQRQNHTRLPLQVSQHNEQTRMTLEQLHSERQADVMPRLYQIYSQRQFVSLPPQSYKQTQVSVLPQAAYQQSQMIMKPSRACEQNQIMFGVSQDYYEKQGMREVPQNYHLAQMEMRVRQNPPQAQVMSGTQQNCQQSLMMTDLPQQYQQGQYLQTPNIIPSSLKYQSQTTVEPEYRTQNHVRQNQCYQQAQMVTGLSGICQKQLAKEITHDYQKTPAAKKISREIQEMQLAREVAQSRWLSNFDPRNDEISCTMDVYEDVLEETPNISLKAKASLEGLPNTHGTQSRQNNIELGCNDSELLRQPMLPTERLFQNQTRNTCGVHDPRMALRNLNQPQSIRPRRPQNLVVRVASVGSFKSHTHVDNQAEFSNFVIRGIGAEVPAQFLSPTPLRSASKCAKKIQTVNQRCPTTATNTERAKSQSTGVNTDIERENVGTATASITHFGKSTQAGGHPSWLGKQTEYADLPATTSANQHCPLPYQPYTSEVPFFTPHGLYGQQCQFSPNPQPAYFSSANPPVFSAPQVAYPQAAYRQTAYPQAPETPCPLAICARTIHRSRSCSPSACCESEDCHLSPPGRTCSRGRHRRHRSAERHPFTTIPPPSLGHTFTVGYVMHSDNELSPVLLPAGTLAEEAKPAKEIKENRDANDTMNQATQVESQRDSLEEEVSQECAALQRAVLEQDARALAGKEKKALRELQDKRKRKSGGRRSRGFDETLAQKSCAKNEEKHTESMRQTSKNTEQTEDSSDDSTSLSYFDAACNWFGSKEDKTRKHRKNKVKKEVHLRVPSKSLKYSVHSEGTATSQDVRSYSTKVTIPGVSSGDVTSDDDRSVFKWSTPKSKKSDESQHQNQGEIKNFKMNTTREGISEEQGLGCQQRNKQNKGFTSKREEPHHFLSTDSESRSSEKYHDLNSSSSTTIVSRGPSLSTNSLKAKIRVAFPPSKRTKKKMTRTEAHRSTSYDTAISSVAATAYSERHGSSADDVSGKKRSEKTRKLKDKSRENEDHGGSCWTSWCDVYGPSSSAENVASGPAPEKPPQRPKQQPRQETLPVLPPPPQYTSQPPLPPTLNGTKETDASAEKKASSGGSFISGLIAWFSRGDKASEETKNPERSAPTNTPPEDGRHRKDSDASFNRWILQVERTSPRESHLNTGEDWDSQDRQGQFYSRCYQENPNQYYQEPYTNEFGQFDHYPAQTGVFDLPDIQEKPGEFKSQSNKYKPDENPRWVIRYSDGKLGSQPGSARVSLLSLRGSRQEPSCPKIITTGEPNRIDTGNEPDFVIRCIQGETSSRRGSNRRVQRPDQDVSLLRPYNEPSTGTKEKTEVLQEPPQGANLFRGSQDVLGEPDWSIKILRPKPPGRKQAKLDSSLEKLSTKEIKDISSDSAMESLKTEHPVQPTVPQIGPQLDPDFVSAPERSPVTLTSSHPPLPRKRRSEESFKRETFEVVEENAEAPRNTVIYWDEKAPVTKPSPEKMDGLVPKDPNQALFDLDNARKVGSTRPLKNPRDPPHKKVDTFSPVPTPDNMKKGPQDIEAGTTAPSEFVKKSSKAAGFGRDSPPKRRASISPGALNISDFPAEDTKKGLKPKMSKESAFVIRKNGARKVKATDSKASKASGPKASGSKASKASGSKASKSSKSKKAGAKADGLKAPGSKDGPENLPLDSKKTNKGRKYNKSLPSLVPPGEKEGAIGSGDPLHTCVFLEPAECKKSKPLSYDCPTKQEIFGYAILTAFLILGLMLLVSVPRMRVNALRASNK